ncbi:MAG: hypothetical protein U0324_33735 [Polyangiales bacterium]
MKHWILPFVALAFAACASDTTPTSAGGASPTASGTRGVVQAGAQDIGEFRAIVGRNEVPSPTTLDATGFFAEHALDLPPAACGADICLNPMLAVAPRFDNGNWTMGFVALSTAVDPASLPRPPLHLVVALTTSLRYLGVSRGLASVFAGLRADDRVSVVLPGSHPRVALHGVAPNDPRLSFTAPGTSIEGALYESLAEAGAAIDSLQGFTGAHRVVLVTSGPGNGYVTDPDRIVGLGAALARRGVALSVIGTGRDYRAAVPAALGSLGAGTYAYAEDDTDMEQILRAEGETRLHPLASDFRLQVTAAPGYRIGRVYGARNAKVVGDVAVLDAPAMFVGSRMGARDVGGGRRGGGGGLFVELLADASMADAVGPNAPAFRVAAAWRDPADGAMRMTSAEARNPLPPGRNPDSMWPTFTDEGRGKVFMMLNMYLAMRAAVTFYDDGDCGRAQGVLDMMQRSFDPWQRRRPDPDIAADGELMDGLRGALSNRCRAVTPVEPRDTRRFGGGCFFI